jgi:hypothetical protein
MLSEKWNRAGCFVRTEGSAHGVPLNGSKFTEPMAGRRAAPSERMSLSQAWGVFGILVFLLFAFTLATPWTLAEEFLEEDEMMTIRERNQVATLIVNRGLDGALAQLSVLGLGSEYHDFAKRLAPHCADCRISDTGLELIQDPDC